MMNLDDESETTKKSSVVHNDFSLYYELFLYKYMAVYFIRDDCTIRVY